MPHQPPLRHAQEGFSFVDLVVILALTALAFAIVIGIFLPSLGSSRSHTRQLLNSTHLRGIHQGIVTFAQSNNQYYPGLDSQGSITDVTVEARFDILLKGDFFTPEYILSPDEIDPTKAILPDAKRPVNPSHYSYNMLQVDLDRDAPRRAEWQSERISSEAIVMSDRAIPHPGGGIRSIHSFHGPNANGRSGWRGTIVFNDNRTEFVTHHQTHIDTRYGDAEPINSDDDLFTAEGDHDAYLIHTGH